MLKVKKAKEKKLTDLKEKVHRNQELKDQKMAVLQKLEKVPKMQVKLDKKRQKEWAEALKRVLKQERKAQLVKVEQPEQKAPQEVEPQEVEPQEVELQEQEPQEQELPEQEQPKQEQSQQEQQEQKVQPL